MNMWDPLLADVLLGPADDKVLDWDKRTLNGWSYVCEGERFLELLEVDSRVLVISWANGSLNLIAEKALKPEQIEQIQKALIDAKLYSSDPSGVLDKETQDAISRWAEGHMSSDAPYRFFRTTITENLLHLMGVPDE
ncbi:hypothetical protein ALP8811_02261 [Aliiroseovarius pelagivivens]|uniref:Uncharacterized protein n=2 Tax=Aliiroseovarius pelagivivens TaxID=1639690 RepID=A0A2R8AMI2_9RHOB|nr:hypothetical protein ALP8811_02261 [Aliiroseovarius pelagivivens]